MTDSPPQVTTVERAKILIVEDEQEVVRVLKRIVESAGYAVTTAANGDEALEIFKRLGNFDLLLTDVVMPGKLQGPALVSAIREADPYISCIFLSGYATETAAASQDVDPTDIWLMKPASRLELLSAVSQSLNSGRMNPGITQ